MLVCSWQGNDAAVAPAPAQWRTAGKAGKALLDERITYTDTRGVHEYVYRPLLTVSTVSQPVVCRPLLTVSAGGWLQQ